MPRRVRGIDRVVEATLPPLDIHLPPLDIHQSFADGLAEIVVQGHRQRRRPSGSAPVRETPAAYVRRALRELGISQKELAFLSDRTQSSIAHILRRNPRKLDPLFRQRIEELKAIKAAFAMLRERQQMPYMEPASLGALIAHSRTCSHCLANAIYMQSGEWQECVENHG